MYIRNEKEFGEAIHDGKETIELDGELAAKVKRLYKLNMALWCFCLASLAVVIIAVMQIPLTAGTSSIASLVAAAPAACIIGPELCISLVVIAVAGGGIGTLHRLRKEYRMQSKGEKVILYLNK